MILIGCPKCKCIDEFYQFYPEYLSVWFCDNCGWSKKVSSLSPTVSIIKRSGAY